MAKKAAKPIHFSQILVEKEMVLYNAGSWSGQTACHSFFCENELRIMLIILGYGVENGESLECALRYFVECLMRLSQKTH